MSRALTDSRTAMPAIIAVTTWRFAPYFMVVFLAGLLAIPRDYYEAAEIDGATARHRFAARRRPPASRCRRSRRPGPASRSAPPS